VKRFASTAAAAAGALSATLVLAMAFGAAAVHAQPVAMAPATSPGPSALAAAAESPAAALGGDSVRALVTPRRYTTLAAEIGVRIDRLPVAEGGQFAAGSLLVSFDCSSQQAQLARARATLEAAHKTQQAHQRLEQLNAVGQLELDMARAEVDKAAADTALYESIVSKCRITAPFAGRVVEQKVREQQFVQPGQTLLEILDDSALDIEFIVPSRWLGWLKPGQPFRVRIDETGRTYSAQVLRLGAKVDAVSQSVKVVGTVDGRHAELLAGMSGRATFTTGRRRD
jgi:membrane fusion protein, multidrug efflux system